MITLIHGDDIVSSRKYFIEEKNSLKNLKSLDSKDLNIQNLVELFKSDSLFSTEKNIFIENFFEQKKSDEFEKIINYVKKNSSKVNLFIWEKDELSKTELSVFPKTKANLFKIPKTLFSFLDNISPNSTNNVLNFHLALKTADEEMIFYMLIRQFRLMLSFSNEEEGSIDEIRRLAPWQKDKLQRQSKLFSDKELKRIYNKLYETDLNIKTGVFPNLTNAIDFLLLDI